MSLWSAVKSVLDAGVIKFQSKATGATVFSIGPAGIGFGPPEISTVAAGVLTVASSFVDVRGEGDTTDTVDSIVKSGQAIGDLLLLMSTDAETITYDNSATMLLGAATRAVAPGGSLLLIATTATIWTELNFTATAT